MAEIGEGRKGKGRKKEKERRGKEKKWGEKKERKYGEEETEKNLALATYIYNFFSPVQAEQTGQCWHSSGDS
jgi:hypothetical protein